jgi:glycosyltransferase involved in cell wall biosynthesis
LALGVEESRIKTIPNGVDVPTVVWKAEDHHRYAAVCIGNISQQPLKGLDVLIEAWAIVTKARGPLRLVIGGRGNATSLIRLAERSGVGELVEFPGQLQDVTSVLLQADLFVLPSRVEGMSNSLLEAMALGMPCVATSVSGSVDLINNGRNGMLVPVDNPLALASTISTVLSSEETRANLGREARRSIEMGYTTERMVGRYRDVLREVDPRLSRRPGAKTSTENYRCGY